MINTKEKYKEKFEVQPGPPEVTQWVDMSSKQCAAKYSKQCASKYSKQCTSRYSKQCASKYSKQCASKYRHGLLLFTNIVSDCGPRGTRRHITFSTFCYVVQMLQWHLVYSKGINILKNLFLYRLSHCIALFIIWTCRYVYKHVSSRKQLLLFQ